MVKLFTILDSQTVDSECLVPVRGIYLVNQVYERRLILMGSSKRERGFIMRTEFVALLY